MRKRVTLKDLAERTGLSISAVSQVLNNNPNSFTSESTRKRVLQLAEEMGYTSNYAYKLLRGKTMNTAAIMLSLQTSDDHIRDLLLLLLRRFDDQGIVVSSNAFSPNAEQNIRKVHELISRGVEKFVFIGSPFGNQEIELLLVKNGLPFVSTSPYFSRCVRWSVEQGMAELFAYLRRKIGEQFRLAVWRAELDRSNYRLEALAREFPELSREELLAKHTVAFDDFAPPLTERDHDSLIRAGELLTAKIRERYPETRGLCFANDYYALGAAKVALERKLVIGRDLLLTGFGDTLAVRCHTSPISSIALDLKKVAQALLDGLEMTTDFQWNIDVQAKIRE